MRDRQMIKALCVMTLFYSVPASAGKKAVQVQDKVFILRESGRPVKVMEASKLNNEAAAYMRMPDLGTDTSAQVAASHPTSHGHSSVEDRRESKMKAPVASSHKKGTPVKAGSHALNERQSGATDHEQADLLDQGHQEFAGLVFKKDKISGQVRLPRVKFARVGVPMELRDEEPSLDFNHKTLKDSGY